MRMGQALALGRLRATLRAMAGSRSYAVVRYRVPSRLVKRASSALLAVRFMGWAVSSRTTGGADLDLYAAGAPPRAAMSALAGLGLRPFKRERASERHLLKNVLPDEPCELAPGVWIDVRGALRDRPERMVLRLPPIAAFGDGRHPTTRIGARLMRGMLWKGKRVLDLGCGTGVLGVLASRWGAASVAFSDIDADAVRATRACCKLNGLKPAAVARSDLLASVRGEFDVVIANLYADVLLALARDPRLERALPSGELVLSGVAAKRRKQVERAFTALGFRRVAVDEEAWWCGLRMRRADCRQKPNRRFTRRNRR
jgi:predicted RNA methylase